MERKDSKVVESNLFAKRGLLETPNNAAAADDDDGDDLPRWIQNKRMMPMSTQDKQRECVFWLLLPRSKQEEQCYNKKPVGHRKWNLRQAVGCRWNAKTLANNNLYIAMVGIVWSKWGNLALRVAWL
mmetsp:Transcript_3661/g.7668  ORF Transcript_3661/g.7668 Transcript_3661/m.7668 type:complete len:127 (+) Transcript_3661:1100-1480(+)